MAHGTWPLTHGACRKSQGGARIIAVERALPNFLSELWQWWCVARVENVVSRWCWTKNGIGWKRYRWRYGVVHMLYTVVLSCSTVFVCHYRWARKNSASETYSIIGDSAPCFATDMSCFDGRTDGGMQGRIEAYTVMKSRRRVPRTGRDDDIDPGLTFPTGCCTHTILLYRREMLLLSCLT